MTLLAKLKRLTIDANKRSVSRRAGLHPDAITLILLKQTNMRAETAFAIARALGVSIEWFLDDSKGWPPVRVESARPPAKVA